MISDGWVRERRFVAPRLLPRRVRSLHTLVLVLLLALCGWLGWLWYRSSSFVKVDHVTVTGLSGPDVPRIREALRSSALQMTTLNIDVSRLEASVSQYSFVRALSVTRDGAHDIRIHVAEQVPVAVAVANGSRQIVDAHGRLLPDRTVAGGPLPQVPLGAPPGGTAITAPGARAAIAVLASAPYALLAHIAQATWSTTHGVIVQLRHGPQLYFGPASQLSQKWNAAVAVLRSRYSAGAAYIDLTDPQRPAPGVVVSPSQATALGLSNSTGTTTGPSSGTGSSSVGGGASQSTENTSTSGG